MNDLVYFNIRLIIAGMLLVIGASLFLGVIPQKLRNTIFDSSRKCVGAAMMVMPLSTFLVCFLSLRSLRYNLNVASFLAACYSISILITVGFVPLLAGKLTLITPISARDLSVGWSVFLCLHRRWCLPIYIVAIGSSRW